MAVNAIVRAVLALGAVAAPWLAARAPVADALPAHPTIAHRAATDSQEIALGAALAARFDADRGIVPSPETQRIEAYLQGIADSLSRHAHRRLPWRIHFDPHPGIKSGFALPGGHIVIWGGILAYMTTEDEAAAVIAHEIEHIDDGQVTRRIDSLVRTAHRDVAIPSQWSWDEFGASYGETLENLCDYKGAKLAVAAGYSPVGFRLILESFVALGRVHSPSAPPANAIVERIRQIEQEIVAEHWQSRTKTRPLQLPGNG
jgi:predicted Zn-dependent protease